RHRPPRRKPASRCSDPLALIMQQSIPRAAIYSADCAQISFPLGRRPSNRVLERRAGTWHRKASARRRGRGPRWHRWSMGFAGFDPQLNQRGGMLMFNQLFQRIVATEAGWAPLALRIPAGIIFIAHGAQKLFGWFGGGGLQGTGEFMASIGLHPGYLMAFLAGAAEFFGGVALIVGLLVRPAGAVLAFTMLVAIFAVHF